MAWMLFEEIQTGRLLFSGDRLHTRVAAQCQQDGADRSDRDESFIH